MMQVDIGWLKEIPGEVMQVKMEACLPALQEDREKVFFIEPVHVDLQFTSTGTSIIVKGVIKAKLQMTCARCLEPFNVNIKTPFNEVYYSEEQNHAQTDWIPFRRDTIELEPEVIKAILLELPMKAVCKPDCRGLCPHCGQNLNIRECDCQQKEIDPRLAKLKDLF